jgi:hypothetical protein
LNGPPKTKIGDPRGGVGGSEAKNGLGSDFFPDVSLVVFLNSPHRETPKRRDKKKSRKNRFLIFGRTFCKSLSTRFFCKVFFCSVFELPSQETPENAEKKIEEKPTSKFLSIFLENVFYTDFLQKCLYGVFEPPLPRNARKCTKKKAKGKKVGWWEGGSGV